MEENKYKEAVAQLLKDGNREALAALIVEWVQPTHLTNDFVSMLLGTRALNIGDALD